MNAATWAKSAGWDGGQATKSPTERLQPLVRLLGALDAQHGVLSMISSTLRCRAAAAANRWSVAASTVGL